jgi:NDP-sugar pyrophosphorylase family protein
MVLAAGLGSRLRPLTTSASRCAYHNRPLLWYLIRHVRRAGIHEIAISLHYPVSKSHWLGRGELSGRVTYSEKPSCLDRLAASTCAISSKRTRLIVHGDVLFDVDLSAVIQYHLSTRTGDDVLHHHHDTTTVSQVNAHGQIAQFVDNSSLGLRPAYRNTFHRRANP